MSLGIIRGNSSVGIFLSIDVYMSKTHRSMNVRGNIPTKFSLGIFRGHFRQNNGPRNFLGNLFPRNSVGKFRGISDERRNSDELFPTTCFVVSLSSSENLAPKLPVRARLVCINFFDAYTELPYGANGVLGLANSSASFVTDLASSYKISLKVALCLPSKSGKDYSGNAFIGGRPSLLPPNREDVTSLMVSTPLMKLKHEPITIYAIDVQSIEVNGKKVASIKNSGPWGNALIGRPFPYTSLETSVYDALVKTFAEKAHKTNAVAPFTNCFSYESFGGKSLLGKEVPVISLVLGGGAKWDIYGSNSLVKVNENVVCLAFERGYNEVYTIDIGLYQMEDNLVEFDLDTSKFSVTSSLLRHNTSCSRDS
ncbi:hypothetical protein F2Q69_00038812 [Brassica cretica]|uniref:Peptidase A1 domain-containing protein n=1 Tax=Brassica cretica TaxID=69181 RepID=A0A8S9SMZ9_BRACR|nr:hypothetical protein F2Q69_00038812 [Brassica cretica]